jgi:BirA family biotin operon repressor/biotin-[acetyl-CoA-carboxylase] ligase
LRLFHTFGVIVAAYRLSADGLKSYITEIELPMRRTGSLPGVTETIFRYGAFVGSVITHYPKLDRAMTHARGHIAVAEQENRSVANGTTIIADYLTGSKGRFTRTWHAPAGGLWGSIIYVNTLLPRSRLLLPLAVGVACCEALRDSGAKKSVIRWINDVLIDGLKIGGFLMESFHGADSGEEFFLIGFGINVNNMAFPDALKDLATSLSRHLGHSLDLEIFTYCFLAKLQWNIGLLYFEEEHFSKEGHWLRSGGRHCLLDRWSELSDSVGKQVVFGFDVVKKPQFEAKVIGISDDGGLQLSLNDGTVITEYSGEIRYI